MRDPLSPARGIALGLVCGLLLWIAAAFIVVSMAEGAGPIRAHGGRACRTIPCYRKAIAWQRHDRAHLRHQLSVHWRRDATYAIRLASSAFHVPVTDMRSVAWCESRMGAQTTAEPSSGASGLYQFLPSTWAHTPFATFNVFDPLPNALAAAQIVAHDGGWRQWTCRP